MRNPQPAKARRITLMIVRHGECVANVEGVVAGASNDSPLTEQGIEQARAAAKQLMGQPIDQIISSPLIRAVRTAEIIRDEVAPGLEVAVGQAFIERDSGVATGTDRLRYLADLKAGVEIAGAESLGDMLKRVKAGLEGLNGQKHTILIVTHEGTARAIECAVTHRPASDISVIAGLGNAEVKTLVLSD